MKLYNFWRSGTSHRLRIALNLKGVPYEYLAVHLGKEEHLKDAFKALKSIKKPCTIIDLPYKWSDDDSWERESR